MARGCAGLQGRRRRGRSAGGGPGEGSGSGVGRGRGGLSARGVGCIPGRQPWLLDIPSHFFLFPPSSQCDFLGELFEEKDRETLDTSPFRRMPFPCPSPPFLLRGGGLGSLLGRFRPGPRARCKPGPSTCRACVPLPGARRPLLSLWLGPPRRSFCTGVWTWCFKRAAYPTGGLLYGPLIFAKYLLVPFLRSVSVRSGCIPFSTCLAFHNFVHV